MAKKARFYGVLEGLFLREAGGDGPAGPLACYCGLVSRSGLVVREQRGAKRGGEFHQLGRVGHGRIEFQFEGSRSFGPQREAEHAKRSGELVGGGLGLDFLFHGKSTGLSRDRGRFEDCEPCENLRPIALPQGCDQAGGASLRRCFQASVQSRQPSAAASWAASASGSNGLKRTAATPSPANRR